MFVYISVYFITVSRSPQSPFGCASPCLFPRLGFGMHSTTQSPSYGAACTVGRSIPASCCFAGLTQNPSNSLYSSLHRVKLENLMYCLIWIDLVLKAEKKQTSQLLLLLLLPQCHCCINSLFLPLMLNDYNEVKVVCQYDKVSETKS